MFDLICRANKKLVFHKFESNNGRAAILYTRVTWKVVWIMNNDPYASNINFII